MKFLCVWCHTASEVKASTVDANDPDYAWCPNCGGQCNVHGIKNFHGDIIVFHSTDVNCDPPRDYGAIRALFDRIKKLEERMESRDPHD